MKESAPGVRTHHLHVVTVGVPQWREYLQFRDALREDKSLRKGYAAVKKALRERYPDDRSAYTAAKRTFVREVLSRQTTT